ncbi:fhkA [Symbiodinium natans]|uniref:FhkA protein n=1 Tax=Symbiodinium natans TaxID=878477 RepID=A0A812R339_9DINO|nr:fhkA [Symbiodinium natans]
MQVASTGMPVSLVSALAMLIQRLSPSGRILQRHPGGIGVFHMGVSLWDGRPGWKEGRLEEVLCRGVNVAALICHNGGVPRDISLQDLRGGMFDMDFRLSDVWSTPVKAETKKKEMQSIFGQAIVYECTRMKTQKKYVKVIEMKAVVFQKNDGEQNLRREIRNMEELFHPRIVNLLTHLFEEDRCWLVMDLARGGDLHNKVFDELNMSISRGDEYFPGLGQSELASKHVAHQLLEGMGYMHSFGIIHRDMKLENVLIVRTYAYPGHAESGVAVPSEVHDVKITDFGLSKNMQLGRSGTLDKQARFNAFPRHSAPLLRRASCVGSPDFVAPEVPIKYKLCFTFTSLPCEGLVWHVRPGLGTLEPILSVMHAATLGDLCKQETPTEKMQLAKAWNLRSCDYWSFGVMTYAMICGEWPFSIRSNKDLVPERHREVVSSVKAGKPWQNASKEARSLIQGLLSINAAVRFSHVDCLHHAWFSSSDSQIDSNKVTICDGLSPKDGAPRGVIQEIIGCTGYAVDNMQMKLVNGTTLSFGSMGGDIEHHWKLRPDERLVSVLQEERHDFLGLAIIFNTSRGDVLALQGSQARKRRCFLAPSGSQIVGLQFQGHRLMGIHLRKISAEEPAAVVSLGGRVGHAVDKVWFRFRDGSTCEYGNSEGGAEQGPWVLEPGEHITAVEQLARDAFLGTSIAFYTSLGSIFSLKGMEAFGSRRFTVPRGMQICGLQFEAGPSRSQIFLDVDFGSWAQGSMIASVTTCPDDGALW